MPQIFNFCQTAAEEQAEARAAAAAAAEQARAEAEAKRAAAKEAAAQAKKEMVIFYLAHQLTWIEPAKFPLVINP